MATATLSPDASGTQAVIERPSFPVPDYASIPVANILPAAREFPDDEWLNIPNVPVFAEHSTTTHSGRDLQFGRKELAAVCSNCNRRIRETGDYAGIVVGHTPDPDTASAAPPMPLVGLAGPFRVGLIRQTGGRAKWAILADFHVQRNRADVIRQYPRRSAELWVEDDYGSMYLDPIALLGAETPRLDMGLLYSATHQRFGRRVEIEKYSACAPSATSVFIPSDNATKKQHRKDYAAADASADADGPPNQTANHVPETNTMSPEDVQQITAALESLDWVQWVKKQMAGDVPADAAAPGSVPPAAPDVPPAPVPDAIPPAPAAPDVAPAAPDAGTPAPPPFPPSDKDDNLPLKYSRLASETTNLRRENEQLRGELENERGKRVNTERYAALADCRRSRLFDLESEFELLKYGKATNEQFVAHLERINANYREIPLDTTIPTFDLPAATSTSRPGGAANREKYSKDVSDKALRIAKEMAMKGQPVSYEKVLEDVASGKL